MINSVNEAVQSVNANENVLFETDAIRTRSATCCGWLQHSAGSGIFQLTKPGIYKIDFNANITSATAGALALAFKNNGEQIIGTEMDSTVATANAYQNVSASRLVRICGNGSASITIGNVGTLATLVKNANIIVEKIA